MCSIFWFDDTDRLFHECQKEAVAVQFIQTVQSKVSYFYCEEHDYSNTFRIGSKEFDMAIVASIMES